MLCVCVCVCVCIFQTFIMPEVSTFKGQFVANIFSFLFAAGRACLVPFLTIYFYYLGLSPIQTGLLLGLKSFTSAWSALCWIKYIGTPKRKRCVLVFSIIVLMLTHLVMMLMPSMSSTKALSFCPNFMNRSSLLPCGNGSSSDRLDCRDYYTSNSTGFSLTSETTDSEMTVAAENLPVSFTHLPLADVKSPNYSKEIAFTKFSLIPKTTASNHVTSQSPFPVPTVAMENIDTLEKKNVVTAEPANISFGSFNRDDKIYKSKNGRKGRHLDDPDESDIDSAVTQIPDEDKIFAENGENSVNRLLKSLNSIQHQVFVALLVLVLVGEMFSSPTEQLTEDLWLRFLDSFEKLDKIHIPKLWSSFGAAMTPWAVVLLIDSVPCILPLIQLPRIFIHFFSFEIVIAMALFLSFCFPAIDSDGSKTKKWSRFTRGLRIVCGDVHSFVCMFTVIVVGFVYGFINTFLFWVMHEKTENGSELALGIALSVAAAGEFSMSFVAGWVVKKLKCPISIILGLVVLCARCLLYSFLFNPWIAVAGETGHMLSHTIIWAAVRNYSAFRVNPLVMDTSAQGALSLIYSGFGISSGCIVAGLCYAWLGPKVMFQIAACVAGVWCIVFAVIYKCCSQWKKQRVRYTKIAQEEIADSDASEDDWLDSAIKHKN